MKRENENNTPPTEQEVDKLKLKIMKKEEEENDRHENSENGIVPNFAEWDDYKYRIKPMMVDEENDLDEDEVNYRDEDEIYNDELPF